MNKGFDYEQILLRSKAELAIGKRCLFEGAYNGSVPLRVKGKLKDFGFMEESLFFKSEKDALFGKCSLILESDNESK